MSSEIQMPGAYWSVINESISFLFRRPCKASGNRKNLDDSTREYDSCWNNCTYVHMFWSPRIQSSDLWCSEKRITNHIICLLNFPNLPNSYSAISMHSLRLVDQIDWRVELKGPFQKPKFPNYKKCTIIIIKSGLFFQSSWISCNNFIAKR